jgi:iron complex transport system substrate-binding protein
MFSMRSIRPAMAVAATALLLLAQGASANEEGDVFKDPSRVAAIGGPITEVVYALGEEGKLIARDSTSLFPEAALQLPDVGYMRALSPEGVLSVNPTAILAIHGSGPKEAVDVLKKASVQYIEVPDRFDREGILIKIRAVGKALGVDAKAEELATKVDADLKAAESLTKDIPQRKRVLFILSMQGGKLLASGTDTAADGIIKMAGAVNAIDGFDGYKQLTDEAAVMAAPDVILMMDRGGDHAALDAELLAHPAIMPTPAGQAKAIMRMEGTFLLGFGPRTAAAAHDLAKALYGDQIKD